MKAPRLDTPLTEDHRPDLDIRQKSILALVCLCAGVAPLAARWTPDDIAKIAYGLLITVA